MKKFDLCIKKKSFLKNDEKVEYYELSTIIDNEKITLQVKDCDKKILKFLLKSYKFNEKGEIVD